MVWLAMRQIMLVLSRVAAMLLLVIESGLADGKRFSTRINRRLIACRSNTRLTRSPLPRHGRGSKYIVAMWTPLAMKCAGVAESDMLYQATVTHEHAHRFAEHEHGDGAEPEQSDAREAGCRAEGGG